MDGIRRTIPRSAKRTPKRETPLKPTPQLSERYVPDFQRNTSVPLPQLRSGSEALQNGIEPTIIYTSEPLAYVRWMPAQQRDALAIVGSGDGEQDHVSVYSVSAEYGEMKVRMGRRIAHKGIVRALGVSENNGMVYIGSTGGQVHRLKIDDWETANLEAVLDIGVIRNREEGVTGVAALSGMIVAAGDHGSLCGADRETGAVWGRQFDEIGFYDAMTVDENGHELTTAGCQVSVWDVRTGIRECLTHPTKGMAMCVTGDPGMPQFVISGTRDGEICIWDRRAEKTPLNRVVLHEGPVWDVCVASGRSGVLVSCGEDGKVWVSDFAKAAMRGGLASQEHMWSDRGEYWRVPVEQSDLKSIGGNLLGTNSVDVHSGNDLFAYATDSGSLGFGRLDGPNYTV